MILRGGGDTRSLAALSKAAEFYNSSSFKLNLWQFPVALIPVNCIPLGQSDDTAFRISLTVKPSWLLGTLVLLPSVAWAQATDLLPPIPGALVRPPSQPALSPTELPTVAVPADNDSNVIVAPNAAAPTTLEAESNTTVILESEANDGLAAAPSVILMERSSGQRIILNPGQDIVVALPNDRVESSASETLLYPLPAVFPVTSGFGMRVHPISGLASFHQGIDLGAPTGTPILAAYSGQVIASGYAGGYGKAVVLAHDDSRRTRYAHMSEIHVSEGDWINQGDIVGLVGSTGNSTGPHLHFEFWQRNDTNEWIALDISEQLQLAIASASL